MQKRPAGNDIPKESSIGNDPPLSEQVRARACDLAAMEGRSPTDVSQQDYEQAKRELAGQRALDRQEAKDARAAETTLESSSRDSTGHQVRESPSDDEDAEGRSASEQLAEQGVAAAEHDQMVQAARTIRKNDRREQ